MSTPEGQHRGERAQPAVREAERTTRIRAVAFARWATWRGVRASEAALLLSVSPGTLERWRRRWAGDRLAPAPRGRPARRPDRRERRALLELLHLMGPSVGLATVQAAIPGMARREVAHLLQRFRRVCRRRATGVACELEWLVPGAVWAMDFMRPPRPVDGLYRHVLVVRDLASGSLLLALPATRADSQTVQEAFRALVAAHGAPLVVKSDNQTPFTAPATAQLVCRCGAFPLLSPPYLPRYNGACEAGIGALKIRAHYASARNGRPGEWRSDDLEEARLMANETGRSRGPSPQAPDLLWSERDPIAPALRQAFRCDLARIRSRLLAARGAASPCELPPRERGGLERDSLCATLVAHELLSIKRRRITLPFSAVFRATIT